jgi:DGQHR domain-containing protein
MAKKNPEPDLAPPEEPKAPLRTPKHIQFPCMTFKQGKHTLILFVANAKALWDLVKINKREEDKDEGYQRALSPARADKIAQFIDAENVLPGSVLISFDDDTKLNKDRDAIVIPNRADAGWVIDGQHRLAGASRSKKDIPLPVVAFIGLSIDEQINCFVTINREQVGVPSSLYYELLEYLGSKSEAEVTKERAADLAQKLKTDEASPFFGKIVVTIAPKRGELSLTNFVRKMAPLLKRDGRLPYYNDEDRQGIINNYYLALHQVFPTEYKRGDSIFFKTLGFGALMNVLPTFIDLCIQNYHGFRVEDAVALFKKIDYFDFGAWHQRGTGSAAEITAADDLRTEFRRAFEGDKNRTTIKLK